jgi:hypothetical protein
MTMRTMVHLRRVPRTRHTLVVQDDGDPIVLGERKTNLELLGIDAIQRPEDLWPKLQALPNPAERVRGSASRPRQWLTWCRARPTCGTLRASITVSVYITDRGSDPQGRSAELWSTTGHASELTPGRRGA